MPKSIGVVKIKIDGELLNSKPGAKLDPGGPVRTAVEANEPGYFSTAKQGSRIEADIIVNKDFSVDKLRNAEDITATFEADTGQAWVINHAYVANPPEITGGSGSAIVIEGPAAQEMK